MRISEEFSGSFLKASDLPQPKVFTISGCEKAKLPEGDTKPALRFSGCSQQLVLNKTNAVCLAEWFGDSTEQWTGRQVELYATQTHFGGRMVPCIRVRLPQQPQQQPMPYQGQTQPPFTPPAAPGFPVDA